jgi:vacuolar-type H+-ATPase subunit I/STV1
MDISERVDILEKNIKELDRKLDRILEILEKDVKKMSDHIDFVEQVYTNVKSPFLFIMDRVNSTFSLSSIENG